jgi:hypothetical protein
MILAVGMSYIASIILKNIPSILSFFRAFIMHRCWILSKAFSASIEMNLWFCPWLCLCAAFHLSVCVFDPPLHTWNETN